MPTQNDLAKTLQALHRPGHPLILTNVWDAISASAIASLPSTTALATASYALAAATNTPDESLTLAQNLAAISAIAPVAAAAGKPLTVDLQDGFGNQLEDAVRAVIRLGAVGANLEDYGREVNGLYDLPTAVERIRRALAVAAEEGVPDFVLNARSDAVFAGEGADDAIARGKAYLEAGAGSVFIWGGPERKGWGREDIKRACEVLGGKLNVMLVLHGEGLNVAQIAELGVARISIGPQLMFKVKQFMAEEAGRILVGAK
ncbi:PEP phosphonomutase-like protein [Coprinopsis sp. MPI-PUGE-AT-0042]|nr:PEP phosphonomutase-like protein [Coprinopsis sp. MPI-PUGE-AT-0042]